MFLPKFKAKLFYIKIKFLQEITFYLNLNDKKDNPFRFNNFYLQGIVLFYNLKDEIHFLSSHDFYYIIVNFSTLKKQFNFINITTLLIIYYKIIYIPIWTLYGIIFINIWFSPKILPIVSINTKAFIMFSKIIRTHFSFIIKYIKISVFYIIMY